MRRIGRILKYTSPEKLGSAALRFLDKQIGIKNIRFMGYGHGSYSGAPLIIRTEDGKVYKLNMREFSILEGRKWKTLIRDWVNSC